MSRISILLALPVLALAACGSNPPAPQTADAQQAVCTRELKVGSNIPVTSCEKPKTDAERQRSVDEVKNAVRVQQRAPAGAGT